MAMSSPKTKILRFDSTCARDEPYARGSVPLACVTSAWRALALLPFPLRTCWMSAAVLPLVVDLARIVSCSSAAVPPSELMTVCLDGLAGLGMGWDSCVWWAVRASCDKGESLLRPPRFCFGRSSAIPYTDYESAVTSSWWLMPCHFQKSSVGARIWISGPPFSKVIQS